jgi:hypothetical protein
MPDLTQNLSDIESDYICLNCGGLLYQKMDGDEEYCLTQDCPNSFPGQIRDNYEPVDEETESEKREIIFEIRRNYSPRAVKKFLIDQLGEWSDNLYNEEEVLLGNLFLTTELLEHLNTQHRDIGRRSRSPDQELIELIEDYKEVLEIEDFAEEMKAGRMLYSNGGVLLRLKYYDIFTELWKNYGIHSQSEDREELFNYEDLDQERSIEWEIGDDLMELMKKERRAIHTFRYSFQKNYRLKQKHDYEVDIYHISTLLGLFFSLEEDVEVWNKTSLKRHFERHRRTTEEDLDIECDLSFSNFEQEFITGEKAPLWAKISENEYCISKFALGIFVLYLVGHLSVAGNEGRESTQEEMQKPKKWNADAFEEEIAELFESRGLKTEENFQLTENSKEFDTVAYNGDDKIFLIEDKFRDISPSSMSRETLISQEVEEEENGILDMAQAQQERYEYFLREYEDLKEEIEFLPDKEDVEIEAYIVAKWQQIISQYKDVEIISYQTLQDIEGSN